MLPWLGKALALLSTVVAAVTAASSTPNVIVFLVDDLGYGDLGIQGNNSYKTPNIDRIGKEGSVRRVSNIHMRHAVPAACVTLRSCTSSSAVHCKLFTSGVSPLCSCCT